MDRNTLIILVAAIYRAGLRMTGDVALQHAKRFIKEAELDLSENDR